MCARAGVAWSSVMVVRTRVEVSEFSSDTLSSECTMSGLSSRSVSSSSSVCRAGAAGYSGVGIVAVGCGVSVAAITV